MKSHIILPPKSILNQEIYYFLYSLLKSILIIDLENRFKKNEKIDDYIKKIKCIYNIELTREYSKKNFENIIKFVKSQNTLYAGDILESILISLFCSVMKIPQKETINKYIYYDMLNVKGIDNKEKDKQNEDIVYIQNFINYDKLFPEELKNKNVFFNPHTIDRTDLEYFLVLIYKLKIDTAKNNKKKRFNDMTYTLYNYSKKHSRGKEENNLINNGIIHFENEINTIYENYTNKSNKSNKSNNSKIISYFFFTLFVNYQTTNSRLMNYTKNNKNSNEFARVPFEYNLIGSSMKGYYAPLMISPLRLDGYIEKVSMAENDFREMGMLEMGKALTFNKNIKVINYIKNRLYSHYLYFFHQGIIFFENDSLEEINLYNNFFKDDVDNYLCDILSKFKNLKTINLSTNKLGSGISKFLNKLKSLYRKKQSNLEKLNINKCSLDKSSLYELCELLKSQYCKLKYLYLNLNYINDNYVEPLLKAIKKNKYLKEVYLGRNFIGNSSTDKIGKVISRHHESLDTLYLNQNEIKNNDNLLRIISRTKVIYSKEEDKNNIIIDLDDNNILTNLDLSSNNINMKNKKQLILFNNIIEDTYLSCLDYSVIFEDFDGLKKYNNNLEFKNEKNNLNKKLNIIKEQRNKLFAYIDEMKYIENKYNEFKQYIDIEDLKDVLIEALGDQNMFSVYEDNIESLISVELLKIIGKTEEDLKDEDNYYLVKNLIKYMLLYKVKGGLINQWLKGINKSLIIV